MSRHKILKKVGEQINGKTVIGCIADSVEESLPTDENNYHEEGAKATVKARELAKVLGIDINKIKIKGIIKEKDVSRFAQGTSVKPVNKTAAGGIGKVEELSSIRKVSSKVLTASANEMVMSFVTVKINVEKALEHQQAKAKSSDGMISLKDYLIKMIAEILVEMPVFNAYLEKDRIYYHKDINIGFVVDREGEIFVPVIKNADKRSVEDIARESMSLKMKVMRKTILPEEYSGGTFTLSSLGDMGIVSFMPIIHRHQSAIASMGSIIKEVVLKDKEPKEESFVNIGLTFDHRLINGTLAAKLLISLKEKLEDKIIDY